MIRKLFLNLLLGAVWASKLIYGADGINVVLKLLPMQLISPTLSRYGAQIGKNVRFRAPLTIHNPGNHATLYYENLQIGDNCYFGPNVFLDLRDRIIVEDQVTISMKVTILTHTDVGESPLKEMRIPFSQSPVIIRRGAYVGAGTIILEGVEIGKCAVIGAGSVVNKNIPAHSTYAGIPARPIK